MDVSLSPDLEARLQQIARESGRAPADLVHDAVAGYVDALDRTRQTLGSRYDDVKSGKVTLIPGDEVFKKLRAKSESRRAQNGQ